MHKQQLLTLFFDVGQYVGWKYNGKVPFGHWDYILKNESIMWECLYTVALT